MIVLMIVIFVEFLRNLLDVELLMQRSGLPGSVQLLALVTLTELGPIEGQFLFDMSRLEPSVAVRLLVFFLL